MLSRHPERVRNGDAGIRQRIIEPLHTLHSRILDVGSNDCDPPVPAADQFVRCPHHCSAVVDLHTVIFFISQRPVNQDGRDLRFSRSFKESPVQTDGEYQDPVHFPADQELKVLTLQIPVIAGIADQHPVPFLMQCLPQIMEHISYKDALDVVDKNTDRLRPVRNKPPGQFIHFIMKFFDRFFDQFPVLRKDIPSVQILRDGRQRQSGPVPDIADRCSHFNSFQGVGKPFLCILHNAYAIFIKAHSTLTSQV